MVSLSITPCIPRKPIFFLSVPSIHSALKAKKRVKITRKALVFGGFVGKRGDILGFLEAGKGKFRENSWCCWCKERWGSEADSELETELLEFMEKSSKPGSFPSRKELVEAGRMDLAEAIKNRGGWFSLGWEESEDEANEGENVAEGEDLKQDFDVEDFQRRVESFRENASLEENEHSYSPSSPVVAKSPFSSEGSSASNQPASSSGRSFENEIEDETGINGILSRLEKERNSSFGIDFGTSVYRAHPSSKDHRDHRHFGTSKDVDRIGGSHGHYTEPEKLRDGDGEDSHSTKPETWRSWSLNRAGFRDMEFEAAEISYFDNQIQNSGETFIHEGAEAAPGDYEALHKWNVTSSEPIQTRLQHLQMELSSVLSLLKSGNEDKHSEKVLGNSPTDFQSLSDALEFQQTEFMSSQERLRSLRAKLAILERKMTLAITDAQKILEGKQTRIDSARKSLELLRTACIVWPNSASKVLLAGSFDGWTSQRKMTRSKTGIFSLFLKLYPGRYEIKFIVDGKWRVDPLRPIVLSNGHENNLLIVSDDQSQKVQKY